MRNGIKQWLQQVTDRALEILDVKSSESPLNDLVGHCHAVLSRKGEATGLALASAVVESWHQLPTNDHLNFFEMLVNDLGPDIGHLIDLVNEFYVRKDQMSAIAIHRASEPVRQELFRRINAAPDGLKTLLKMRESLQPLLKANPNLRPVDSDFIHLFGSWFNKGFLKLEQINWQTPAAILEKLIQYESVHEIQGWDDLRRRLSKDRLCFAYFHPVIPDEPLIFVEVALVDGIAHAIAPLLTDEPTSPVNADTAVFYSINNCQPGLAGVSFGNLLIKQVVSVLQQEHSKLRQFVTLSPIVGFKNWLDNENPECTIAFTDSTQPTDLSALVVKYLTTLKSGRLIDPVARFHLGNGAILHRINRDADMSEQGQAQSFGYMVNYLYELESIVRNHEELMESGTIAMSKEVQALFRKIKISRKETTNV